MRVVDMIVPIGFGQRGLIVSPPARGQNDFDAEDGSQSVLANYPDAYVIMLLIDERPEEVTDMEREVKGRELRGHQQHLRRARRPPRAGERDLLFHDEPGTVLLNLGGIGNLTRVDELPEEVIAFDTGPANLPLNEIVRLMTSGEKDYDEGGLLASQGVVDPELMAWLESDPFLPMPPPKSTGRERFGEAWTAEVLSRQGHRRLVDILATMTAFVARAVKRGLDEFVAPRSLRRLLVSGGGVHNATLMHHLARELAPLPVESFAKRGFDPDAKEAVLFALLAHERLLDRPSGMPAATGATYAAIQGVIC